MTATASNAPSTEGKLDLVLRLAHLSSVAAVIVYVVTNLIA